MTFASSFDGVFTLIFGLGNFSFFIFIVFFRQFYVPPFLKLYENPNTAWKIKSTANFHAWEQYQICFAGLDQSYRFSSDVNKQFKIMFAHHASLLFLIHWSRAVYEPSFFRA